MLVVLSEGYLASEWCRREHNEFLASVGTGSRCRREVQLARTPIRATHVARHARDYIWRVRPTVVTVTMHNT